MDRADTERWATAETPAPPPRQLNAACRYLCFLNGDADAASQESTASLKILEAARGCATHADVHRNNK